MTGEGDGEGDLDLEGLGEGDGEGEGLGDLRGLGEWLLAGDVFPVEADGVADPFVSFPPSSTAIAMTMRRPTSTMAPAMIQGPLAERCFGMDRG